MNEKSKKCPDCQRDYFMYPEECDTCKKMFLLSANSHRVYGLLRSAKMSGVSSATCHDLGHHASMVLNWHANLFSLWAFEDSEKFEKCLKELDESIKKGDAYLANLAKPYL